MKQVFGAIGIFLGVLIVLIGLNFVFGWTDVYFTKTVGKAQQNAQRTVFEETQSYVEGKRQEVTKLRFEYLKAKDKDEKEAIKAELSFEEFLRVWCRRGSQGLEASWLKPEEKKQYKTQADKTRDVLSGLTRGLIGGNNDVKLL